MNYGLYIATSGMLTQMARLDVASNNLANVSTVAYKPDTVGVRARDVATVEDSLPFADSNRLLERLGAGPWPTKNSISFSAGPLEKTDGPLDIALQSEGFFTLEGDGPDSPLYTRDGRLTINRDSILVSATTGRPVISEDGRVIRLDTDRRVTIHSDGRVEQDGGIMGQIRVRGITDLSRLEKSGENLYTLDAGEAGPRAFERPVATRIEQGFLEGSGVDPVRATMAVTDASKAVQGAGNLIQYFDGLMDQAINTLGAVS